MAADEAPAFSREERPGGLPARRASTLLFAIESRTALLVARARRAMARFETERTAADQEQSFLAALAGGRTPPANLRIQDVDRHAAGWADLVPPDPPSGRPCSERIVEKYGLPDPGPRAVERVLGADDPAVAEAYQRQTGMQLGRRRRPARCRSGSALRWFRAAHLPPAREPAAVLAGLSP